MLATRQRKRSVFQLIIMLSVLVTTLSLGLISIIFYQNTIVPIKEKVFKDQSIILQKELQLRLIAKEDSVVSMVASLARDARIIEGLSATPVQRDPLMAAIASIRTDYANISQYKNIRAQVIGPDQVILTRSWDINFQGEKAPHPLVKTVMNTLQASASFGVGNAGVGVIGFAPVLQAQKLLGLVSITQNIGSVIKGLKEIGIDWVMLVYTPNLVARTNGKLPAAYKDHPIVSDDLMLAHPTLFDADAIDFVKANALWGDAQSSEFFQLVDGNLVFSFPVLDESNKVIGRHILSQNADALLARISETEKHFVTVTAMVMFVLLLVVLLILAVIKSAVIRPLNAVTDTIIRILKTGQFDQPIIVSSEDELGQMMREFNSLLKQLSVAISEANDAVSAAASEDFSRKMQGRFEGDLGRLQQGINAAIDRLNLTHEQLTQATKAKSQFLANMSHEIRTPINGIVGMLTLLQGSSLTQDQLEHLRLAQSSVDLLLGVINDILDVSKIEAGKMTIEHAPYDLLEMLANHNSVFAQVAINKGITLHVERAPSLSRFVMGDVLRVRQVITNLMSNAIKFTEQGSVALSVSIKNNLIRFSITDTGIGMSPSVLANLFQSFSQADASTSRKFGGTGLGLTISKDLVVLMGGNIGVESELGKGSCFWFVLPYEPVAAPEIKEVSNEIPSFKGKQVLLVEDNLINQKVATKLLERFDIYPVVAQNGQEAIHVLENNIFDLVLMDCQMPIMDGYAATRLLRQQDFKTPIVAMTANASAEDRAACIACGMNDFIAKPYQMQILSEVLQRWLKDY